MRKLVIASILSLLSLPAFCRDNNNTIAQKLLSVLTLKPTETTPANVSTLLGKPDQIEQGGRQNTWHYTNNNEHLIIYWDGKVIKMQKLSFTTLTSTEKQSLDNDKAKQLRSGETAFIDALKLLGVPKELDMKGLNQELHYIFKDSKLNLFFRNGTLVNYTLF